MKLVIYKSKFWAGVGIALAAFSATTLAGLSAQATDSEEPGLFIQFKNEDRVLIPLSQVLSTNSARDFSDSQAAEAKRLFGSHSSRLASMPSLEDIRRADQASSADTEEVITERVLYGLGFSMRDLVAAHLVWIAGGIPTLCGTRVCAEAEISAGANGVSAGVGAVLMPFGKDGWQEMLTIDVRAVGHASWSNANLRTGDAYFHKGSESLGIEAAVRVLNFGEAGAGVYKQINEAEGVDGHPWLLDAGVRVYFNWFGILK